MGSPNSLPSRTRIPLHPERRERRLRRSGESGIEATDSDWVLTLNPDVVLDPGYLERLLDSARHSRTQARSRHSPSARRQRRLGGDFDPALPAAPAR